MSDKKYILTRAVAEKKLLRMAYEIIERNPDAPEIILAGIKDNGVIIAHKIHECLLQISNIVISVHEIRMDKKNPLEININPDSDLNNKIIILVDDVANSGRTLLYALKPLLQFHPQKIQTLVLVERTHKLFPLTSDYVGLSVGTTLQEHIVVEVSEDQVTGAYLI